MSILLILQVPYEYSEYTTRAKSILWVLWVYYEHCEYNTSTMGTMSILRALWV
jgi:hypothetical protein